MDSEGGLDMIPCLAKDDFCHATLRDAKVTRNRPLGFAIGGTPANFNYIGIGQWCLRRFFAKERRRVPSPSLLRHVSHIVLVGA